LAKKKPFTRFIGKKPSEEGSAAAILAAIEVIHLFLETLFEEGRKLVTFKGKNPD